MTQIRKPSRWFTLLILFLVLFLLLGWMLTVIIRFPVSQSAAQQTLSFFYLQTQTMDALTASVALIEPTMTAEIIPIELPTIPPKPTFVTLTATDWKNWPTVPDRVSEPMKTLYRMGAENGRNADAFSKIGDSNSVMPSFLGCFDSGALAYDLGPYSNLAETITQFQGSFGRNSRATRNGITALELDVIHWYADDICWPAESALSCEIRLNKPSIVLIALGTNDALQDKAFFDEHLRSLVQKSIDRFSVPILVTKADNTEGDESFNALIAQIALDFEVPLLNLWRAMNPLPNGGLSFDNIHPSFNEISLCDFSGDDLKEFGWSVRNLTTLQSLDSVWRMLNDLPVRY